MKFVNHLFYVNRRINSMIWFIRELVECILSFEYNINLLLTCSTLYAYHRLISFNLMNNRLQCSTHLCTTLKDMIEQVMIKYSIHAFTLHTINSLLYEALTNEKHTHVKFLYVEDNTILKCQMMINQHAHNLDHMIVNLHLDKMAYYVKNKIHLPDTIQNLIIRLWNVHESYVYQLPHYLKNFEICEFKTCYYDDEFYMDCYDLKWFPPTNIANLEYLIKIKLPIFTWSNFKDCGDEIKHLKVLHIEKSNLLCLPVVHHLIIDKIDNFDPIIYHDNAKCLEIKLSRNPIQFNMLSDMHTLIIDDYQFNMPHLPEKLMILKMKNFNSRIKYAWPKTLIELHLPHYNRKTHIAWPEYIEVLILSAYEYEVNSHTLLHLKHMQTKYDVQN